MAAIAEKQAQFFTYAELAERWKVSQRTIEREVCRGRIVKTLIGGQVRFSRDEVAKYERTATA